MNNLKKILIIILLNLFTFADDTINIVYNSATPPLKFTDNNNKPAGMLIDIWKLWAEKNNQKIRFIETTWDNTFEMIKNGEAHIHAGLYYLDERDEFLDYTSKPLYTNRKYFFYDKTIPNIKKIEDFKPYVIGVDNGYAITYLKKFHPYFHRLEFNSANEANEAFFSKDVKVVLASLPTFYYYLKTHNLDENSFLYGETTLAFSKKYYGAVKQGNKKLLDLIESGFKLISKEEIKNIELKWTKELNFDKKVLDLEKDYFTKEEQNYLKEKKVINMCVDPAWLPFEQINEKGQHEGIVADVFKLFQKSLDIPIKVIKTENWSEAIAYAKLRRCDILSAAIQTPNRKKYMDFTNTYLSFPGVLVTKDNEPFIVDFENIIDKKIGVVKNYAIMELIKIKYPNINLYEVKNIEEGLFKVSSGELFGLIDTSAAVSFAMAKNGMTNLKIASKIGIDYNLNIAVRNDQVLLLDIFNKIIKMTDKNEIKDIQDNWVKVKFEEIVDYNLVYKILGWFLFIFIIIFFWNRKLKKEIDERIKAQSELNKFSQIIEQSKVSIMLTNLNGEIIYVNPYCIKESGYTKKELMGSKPNIFKSGFQDSSFYQKLWKTINSGDTWHGEFSNKKKNGEIYWENATIAPIFDKNKNIKFFASIKQNITEKVKVQEKLIVAQKEANKANEIKSDFLAKMSHEIRTPMNAVLGMLYLLEKTQLSDTQKNYTKKANLAANSLLGIINDILDFSKIEANKLEIKNSEFNIYELVSEIMSIMSVKAEDHNLELLTQFDDDIPIYLISDRLRLAQILNNLISNAIKFTKKGEVLVHIKFVEKDISGNAVLKFCVKDSGIGISKENQSKLFKEFMQVDDSVTRSFNGTGLGLAISKKLVELLGGEIYIESSDLGVGTTICFTIKAKTTTKKEHLGFIFPSVTSNLKVLVVDDNKLATDVLCDMLNSFNYYVDSVSNGYEAIQKVQENSYDMVFLDYKMPNLNGLATFIKYKEILKEKTPKTVMVTAYSSDVIQLDVQNYGIYGYLLKPVSPSTLYDKIMEILYPSKTVIKVKNQETKKVLETNYILLVEDNELNREFAIHVLEGFGLKVDIAVDGVEAIEKVISQKYKLVLMDIQMPRLDGLSATKKIRKLNGDYFKNLPIIALSANALVGDEEKSLNAGMNEHITKPLNTDKLYNILKKYILEKDIELGLSNQESLKYVNILNPEVFDVEEALNRVSGNEVIYVKILHQFRNNYNDVLNYIEKLLRNNDLVLLEKKIHELKGVAGNIAAKKLFGILSLINGKLINGSTVDIELIEQFKTFFDEVINEIDKLEIIDKEDLKDFDKEIVIELLIDLKDNLNIDIVRCDEIFEKLSSYLKSEYKDFYMQLNSALNDFDTDKVNSLIDEFLKEIENAK